MALVKKSIICVSIILSIMLSIASVHAALCYKCEASNAHCADPVVFGAPGVDTCVAPYCLKSFINHEGISVAVRMCSSSPAIESGCIDQVIGGMPARACVCTEDLCNGSD